MQRRLSRIFALALGIPLLLALLAACGSGTTGSTGGGSSTPAGSTTIKIATDLPVSGKDTSSGKPAENGAHMAVDEANTANTIPGYKLVFVPKDDVGPSGAHDPAVGAQNVTSLIGDALVAGIVGPFNSSVAQSEMPIANQAPIALISPSNTNQCLTQTGADIGCTGANNLVPTLRPTGKVTYFRIATTDNHQGPANADYLFKNEHYKTAYAIDDAETYGIGIANTFSGEWTKLGGTVLGRSSEPGTTTSFVSLLTQIASKKPDVIYFGGTDATGGTLIRQQMQQVPALKNTPFAGGDGIVTANFASTIGLTGGPVFGTVASSDVTKNPAAATFVKNYTATYGPLGAYSAAGYDCAKILIQAIKSALANGAKVPKDSSDAAGAKTFRQAVIDAMQKTDYTGLTGHHTFDSNGDTTNKIITVQQLATVDGKPNWKVLASLTVQ
ncbi:MAG TPA: branched-chain amino acid ABC transporter substrate-binding protein [Ktedonobacteraceae bacterium]|nr:branched-chain amino acid ABC transporter substrate-binding protein [Ktedonobacteraceae bacterium]